MAGVEDEDSVVEEVVVENNTSLHHNKENSDQTSTPKAERRKSNLVLKRRDAKGRSLSVSYQPDGETVFVISDLDGSSTYSTDNDPPITDLNLLLARTFVEDARDGRHSDFKLSERHLKLYHLYQNIWGQWLLYLVIALHLLLALFEKPAVPGLEITYWVTMLMEVGAICFYLVRLIHISVFTPLTRFWSDTKHILIIILTVDSWQDLHDLAGIFSTVILVLCQA